MRRDREQNLILFGKVMILVFLLFNAWMTYRYYFNFIDSDDASELILAQMLASEGKLLTTNWYYSTELRVLNTQLVYMPLFYIFSSYKRVRIFGQVILSCLFLGSYYFCLYGIDRERAKPRFWKTAFLLLIPIEYPWIFLTLKAYYIPHISISFLALGIICLLMDGQVGKRQKIWLSILNLLLGFVAGMGGIRSLQITYIPFVLILCREIWNYLEKNNWSFRAGGVKTAYLVSLGGCSAAAAAGYLINEFVLRGIYHFESFKNMKYRYFWFGSLENVIQAYMETMGYRAETHIFSLDGIGNVLACLAAVLFIGAAGKLCYDIKKYKTVEQIVILFVVFSFGISIFIFVITCQVISRYVMACVSPAILLILFWEKLSFNKQYAFTLALWGAVFVLGMKEYRNMAQMDGNEDKRNMIAYITEHGYTHGYATFWNANIVTELTNGQITFRNLHYDDETGEITKYNWLTPVSPGNQGEPVIAVFQRQELEQTEAAEDLKAVFEDEVYIIYEFDSEAELDRAFGL